MVCLREIKLFVSLTITGSIFSAGYVKVYFKDYLMVYYFFINTTELLILFGNFTGGL